MKSIGVFCGAHTGDDPVFRDHAAEFGRLCARRGIQIVYGGGHIGLMGVVADAAMREGGRVIGVIPRDLRDREVAHGSLTTLHVVDGMHERKALMGALSEAFVALPGGLGTLEELFEVLTWAQLGFHGKPCAILNVAGYFDDLLAFLDHGAARGFIAQVHRDLVRVADDAEAVLKRLHDA